MYKNINEQEQNIAGDQMYAQELLQIQTWYNQEKKRLDDTLAKKKSDALVKYQTRSSGVQQKPNTANTNNTTNQSGYVDAAGNPVKSNGQMKVESYSKMNEAKVKINDSNKHVIQSLKDFLDADEIPYIEYDNALEFEEFSFSDEWQKYEELLKDDIEEDIESPFNDDDNYGDILEVEDDTQDSDYDNLIYVKILDGNNSFIGKIYKTSDDSEWQSKLLNGKSKTFEKLNYNKDWDHIDIVSFLRENYDDANIIDENEINYEKIS